MVNFNSKSVKYNFTVFVVFALFIILIAILALFITDTVYRQNYTHPYHLIIRAITITILVLPAIFITIRKIRSEIHSELEEKVNERTIELTHKLEAKSNFLANMSHEIRTPNHAILNCSKYVETDLNKLIAGLEEYKATADSSEAIDKLINIARSALKSACRVRDASNRQGVLLNNILDLSKLGEGKMEMNIANNDLKAVIQGVIKENEGLYKGGIKELDVIFEEPVIDTTAEFDSLRMTQVITNLLSNAIKYSAQGVISLKVKDSYLELKDSNKVLALEFRISDQGIGIPADELEKVFEKFAESSTTKKQSCGTGIGLAICKEIISSHHGKIWAENNKEKGSTFIFVIPVKSHN